MKVLMIGMAALLAVGLAAELALIQPGELAAQLATKGAQPAIFQVGPNVVYRGKHIGRSAEGTIAREFVRSDAKRGLLF
jgi:hypothetical protein